jgi:5-methylcytosine-specific restriction endonuclease McrA
MAGTYERTPEWRAAASAVMSALNRRRWQDPAYREKRLAGMREQSRQNWDDPAYRAVHVLASAGANNPRWKGGSRNPKGPGWKAARRVVWARDKVCRLCSGPPSKKRRLDVHHVVPRREGGTNDPGNLIGLHHWCHMKVEAGKVQVLEEVPII